MQDKIENNRYEKNIKLFKWVAYLSIIPIGYKLVTIFISSEFKTNAYDLISLAIPLILFFNYKRTAKNWGGQFIEWNNDILTFKTKDIKEIIISIENINKIEIKLDSILILTNENKTLLINLEDYTDYKDRLRIKKNFEAYSKSL